MTEPININLNIDVEKLGELNSKRIVIMLLDSFLGEEDRAFKHFCDLHVQEGDSDDKRAKRDDWGAIRNIFEDFYRAVANATTDLMGSQKWVELKDREE